MGMAMGMAMGVTAGSRECAARAGKRRHDVAGFTLVELLVVFSLLALLLSIAAPRYLKTLDASKEKAQAQNLATIRDALDKFRADQGRYPAELSELVEKKYLRQVPLDPVSNSKSWVAVPEKDTQTGVYDVQPPRVAQETGSPETASPAAPGAEGAGAK